MTHRNTSGAAASKKFHIALDACSIGIAMLDGNGEIMLVNSELERQFGYAPEELIGRRIEMLLPVHQRGHRIVGGDGAGRIGPALGISGLRKDGREFPLDVGLTSIDTGHDRITLATFADASPREEQRPAQPKARYQKLLEAAPVALVVTNQNEEIILLNHQAEKQFGYRRDELVGQNVKRVIPAGFGKQMIAGGVRDGEGTPEQQIGTWIETVGMRKDGGEFPLDIKLSVLEFQNGTLVTAATRDISARKQVERLKDEFVSNVSHELRTPLTSILGSLGLLAKHGTGQLPESAARLVEIAYANGRRLIHLVNDILDVEKMELGSVAFEFRKVEVHSLIEQVVEGSRGFADTYGVHIRLDRASADAEVNADPDRLAQVVTNLLSNAIKYSPAGEEVLVWVEKDDDLVRISVRDRGPGIPADFRPRIFEKFAQADASQSRQKGGSGLGLSIVRQIVDRLDGKVSFADADGGGTVFRVELPAWDRAADRHIDLEPRPSAARILLCEDDRDVAATMREGLRRAGFAVDLAYTAVAAVACAEATNYAAILVDLLLPDGDGVGLILGLREQERYHDTPIIVVSGNPSLGRDDVRSSRLNVFGWLRKPVELERLVLVLRASIALQPTKRPRVLHVNGDPNMLAVVAHALRATADVISANSIEDAHRALAGQRIDLAVVDVSPSADAGPDLLPDLRDVWGHAIPIMTFSAQRAGFAGDKQIQAALMKADVTLENFVAAVRERLALPAARATKEVA